MVTSKGQKVRYVNTLLLKCNIPNALALQGKSTSSHACIASLARQLTASGLCLLHNNFLVSCVLQLFYRDGYARPVPNSKQLLQISNMVALV